VSGKWYDDPQFDMRCPMCRYYLGHRLGAIEKCPACGKYGPLRRAGGGCGCILSILLLLLVIGLFVHGRS
jgi:hypothetical protein